MRRSTNVKLEENTTYKKTFAASHFIRRLFFVVVVVVVVVSVVSWTFLIVLNYFQQIKTKQNKTKTAVSATHT